MFFLCWISLAFNRADQWLVIFKKNSQKATKQFKPIWPLEMPLMFMHAWLSSSKTTFLTPCTFWASLCPQHLIMACPGPCAVLIGTTITWPLTDLHTKPPYKDCVVRGLTKKIKEKKRGSFSTDISLAMPQCLSYMLHTQDLWASLLNKSYSPKATEAKPGWWGVRECTLWPLKSELAWLCGSRVEWTWVEEREEQAKDIWVIGMCFLGGSEREQKCFEKT